MKRRRNRRKREKRAANPTPVTMFPCEHCKRPTKRLCKTQRTCQRKACKVYLQTLRDQRRTDRGPTLSETVVCEICKDEVPRLSPTHILCDKEECHRTRSAFLQRENRRVMAYRKWEPCPVCDEVVEDTRKTYHPECRRQLRNDKKRFKRAQDKIRREKLKKLRESQPKPRRKVVDRPVYTIAG